MQIVRKVLANVSPFTVAVVAVILIGVNGVATKIGYTSIDPIFFNGARYLGIGIVVSAFVLKLAHIQHKGALKILGVNILISLATLVAYAIGLDQSTALKAALLSLTTPVFMYLLSITFLKEKLIKQALIGCVIALLGSLLIIGLPALLEQRILLGDMLLLTAYFLASLMFVHSKKLYQWYRPIEVVGYRFGSVGLLLCMYALVTSGFSVITDATAEGLLALAFATIICGIIAMPLFYWALQKITAEEFAPILYIEPMVGAIAATIVLGEVLQSTTLAGVFVIIIGVSISHPHHSHVFHRLHVHHPHPKLHKIIQALGNVARKLHFHRL